MRAVWLVLLVAMPAHAGVPEAVEWLIAQPPSVASLEALHAAGMDTRAEGMYGEVAVPDYDPELPGAAIRALHAVATSGYDPRAYPDPHRGVVDLVAQWHQHDGHIDELGAASLAFHVLAAHALGIDRPAEALERLAGLQGGGFPCGVERVSLDCTGFAVAGLRAWNASFDHAAAATYVWDAYNETTGAFDDGNANTQAWSLIALTRLDQPVPGLAWSVLLDLQADDGRFWYTQTSPGTGGLATADAVLALTAFPGPRYAPLRVTSFSQGIGVTLSVDGWERVTWSVNGEEFLGPLIVVPEPDGATVHVYATRAGEHARTVLSWPSEEVPLPLWPWLSLLVIAQRRKRA